jgi:hypothetical protein
MTTAKRFSCALSFRKAGCAGRPGYGRSTVIETRTVELLDTLDGQTTRVVREYLAIDQSSHDAYTFGTDVTLYTGNKVSRRSWRAGRDGASARLYRPAHPQPGAKFTRGTGFQVEVTSLDERVETPSAVYPSCLSLNEQLPLVLSRLELIEQLAPDAMDETNAAAFKEA